MKRFVCTVYVETAYEVHVQAADEPAACDRAAELFEKTPSALRRVSDQVQDVEAVERQPA